MSLSESQINELDNYIEKNNIKEDIFCISPRYSEYFKKTYKKILNDEVNTYIIIYSSGYSTYSLYKRSNSKIYLFTIYLEKIDNCIIIKN